MQTYAARVRRALKAGEWYPEDPAWAIAEMTRMLRLARNAPVLKDKPLAIVVPHAGFQYSGVAAAAAYRNLQALDYQRVVLIGPSHVRAFTGFSLPRYDAYETPLGRIPVCAEAEALRDGKLVVDDERADANEHSLELQLPWLKHKLGAFCIVPILVGFTTEATERALAERLAKLPQQGTLYVVSSDFVHYGERFSYTPFGGSIMAAQPRVFELESRAIELFQRLDAAGFRKLIAESDATICGYRGILVLQELLRRVASESHAVALAHYSSAQLGEEREPNSSVSYVSLAFVKGPTPVTSTGPIPAPVSAVLCSPASFLDEAAGQALLRVARATLETELLHESALSTELAKLPEAPQFDCLRAVFVTLKKKGNLRGCVGQVQPTYPLFEATVRAALDAALNDRRFEPVSPSELASLSFELSALTAPVEVPSYRDIVLGKHGIILSVAGHRALFLPQVPLEQGFTLEQTLQALSEKAGLPSDAWKVAEARFSVFTANVFEEPRVAPAKGASP
jgi:AmmeMemoRadiSam system protein B/AmmeMemoRadiSam system protein A